MGLDWKLIDHDGGRSLDVQGFGTTLQYHASEDTSLTLNGVREALVENKVDRQKPPWKGIWAFVREASDAGRRVVLVNEHQEGYDADDGYELLSVFARGGRSKRLGYGPS